MGHWKKFLEVSTALVLGLLLSFTGVTAQTKPSAAAPGPLATKSPEHPITEEQLRTYFKVVHILSRNRELTHEQMEAKRKKLPEWYPPSVWDEIEAAIENVDLAVVDLPVYQKYISEEDASGITRFSATPQAQRMIQAVLDKEAQEVQAGVTPLQARDQAIADLRRDEGEELNRIVLGMDPEYLRYLESHSDHFLQMQPLTAQMHKEAGKALREKQTELTKAIVAKHQSELAEAKRSYEASHASSPGSRPPQ